MKRSERKELYKCNTKDLVYMMNNKKYSNDKGALFNDVMKYIARHEMYKGNTKSDLNDLIYTARNEFINLEAKKHADSKEKIPYDRLTDVTNNATEQRIKDFIKDPVKAMKNEMVNIAKQGIDEHETDIDKIEYEERIKVNAQMLYTEIGVSKQQGEYEYGNHPDRIDVVSRIMKKNDKDANIDESIKRVNSGVFGRLFRRPSKEYTAFENSLKEFNDAGMAHAGNIDDLEKKTTAYLKHTFPDYDFSKQNEKQGEWLNCLPASKRGRAQFAMSVLSSIDEHKKMKPYMQNVENAVNGRPIDESLDENKIDPSVDRNNQMEFQNNLINDLNNDDIIHDQPVVDPGRVKVQEKEVDEEKLDATESEIEL